MDVAFGDNIICPRRLILEVNHQYQSQRYTVTSERGGGVGSQSDDSLMTKAEFIEFVQSFRDELTGKEMREAIENANAPFTEPPEWDDYRRRYAETGDPFLK